MARNPVRCPTDRTLRGLHFMAKPRRGTTDAGKDEMVAYEYTTAPAPNLSGHEKFIDAFLACVRDNQAEGVYGLSVDSLRKVQGVSVEFEHPSSDATVTVREADFPETTKMHCDGTAWVTQDVYLGLSLPDPPRDLLANVMRPHLSGILKLKCVKYRRHDMGLGQKLVNRAKRAIIKPRRPDPASSTAADRRGAGLEISGVPIEQGSPMDDCLDRAMQFIQRSRSVW